MPNYVMNWLEIDVNDRNTAIRIIEEMNGPTSAFDFENLIPMPLSVFRGPDSRGVAEALMVAVEIDKSDFSWMRGEHSWYGWSIKNWGTKWNAGSCKVEFGGKKLVFRFQTAWSPPMPVIVAFANRFRLPFVHTFACEGECVWGVHKWGFDAPHCPEFLSIISRLDIRNASDDAGLKKRIYDDLWPGFYESEDEDDDPLTTEITKAAEPEEVDNE